MAEQIWFGTEGDANYPSHFEWLPCPRPGMQRSRHTRVVGSNLDNGGYAQSAPTGSSLGYTLDVIGEAHGLGGIDLYNQYATGFYGTGRFYFADPMEFDNNLFPAHWAAPGLAEQGYPSIGTYDYNGPLPVTYSATNTTAVTSFNAPTRSVTYSNLTVNTPNMTRDGGPFPRAAYTIIPVPPGYELRVGFSGAQTGTARVQYSSSMSTGFTALTPIAVTTGNQMNTTLATPASGFYVFTLQGGTTTGSTLTINSMMAQLWPTGTSPATTPMFIAGGGHSGLAFTDDARVETYNFMDRDRAVHYKGLSTELRETGAWSY